MRFSTIHFFLVCIALCSTGMPAVFADPSLANSLIADLSDITAVSPPQSALTTAPTSTQLSGNALARAEWVFENTRQNHYEHGEGTADAQVSNQSGEVTSLTDCSGFMSYVLKQEARKHYETIVRFNDGHRPRASTFAEFFATLTPAQSYQGWLGVSSVKELGAGDLIAWESPKFEDTHQGNSGHVMMVVGAIGDVTEERLGADSVRYISIPVIDASSVWHFAPEQLPPHAHQEHRDGVGKGSIRLVLDSSGNPAGYWEGSYWGEGQKEIRKPTLTKNIHFARLVGLRD